jgi:hypothetical protein
MKDKDLCKIYSKMKKEGEVKSQGRVSKKKSVGKFKSSQFQGPSMHSTPPAPWWNYWGQGPQAAAVAGLAGHQGLGPHGQYPRPEMRACLWCRQTGHLLRNCPMRAPPLPPTPGPPPK